MFLNYRKAATLVNHEVLNQSELGRIVNSVLGVETDKETKIFDNLIEAIVVQKDDILAPCGMYVVLE